MFCIMAHYRPHSVIINNWCPGASSVHRNDLFYKTNTEERRRRRREGAFYELIFIAWINKSQLFFVCAVGIGLCVCLFVFEGDRKLVKTTPEREHCYVILYIQSQGMEYYPKLAVVMHTQNAIICPEGLLTSWLVIACSRCWCTYLKMKPLDKQLLAVMCCHGNSGKRVKKWTLCQRDPNNHRTKVTIQLQNPRIGKQMLPACIWLCMRVHIVWAKAVRCLKIMSWAMAHTQQPQAAAHSSKPWTQKAQCIPAWERDQIDKRWNANSMWGTVGLYSSHGAAQYYGRLSPGGGALTKNPRIPKGRLTW